MLFVTRPGLDARPTRRYLRPPVPLFFPSEEEVPETLAHLRLRTALYLIIERELRGRAFVGSEQFVYWDPTDSQACLAPDVLVRLGGPLEQVRSLKTWLHGAPHVAVEVVSPDDRRDREWDVKLERFRRAGIPEVVRFDPDDRKCPLRLWDSIDGDLVERDASDAEAFRCDALGAYWVIVADATLGPMLRLARDREGTDLWITAEEAELAERAGRDAVARERDAALARIAELEAELRRRG